MIKKIISIIAFLTLNIFLHTGYSQTSTIIPDSNRVDWSNVGIPGDIPEYPVQYNIVEDFGAVGDGVTDNTSAFNQAIGATEAGNALYVPEGRYLISGGLRIGHGLVIRGAGPEKTEIIMEQNSNFFNVWGGAPVAATVLSTAAYKGSNMLTVASASEISSGDIICVARIEDGVPQIVEVSAVNGSQIELSGPLYSDFTQGSNVSTLNKMVHGFGLEDIKLNSVHEPTMKSKVSFQYVARSWIKNIETLGPDYVEINIMGGFQCEVRDCYFHQDYELAEHYPSDIEFTSYGIELGSVSTDNLIENNIFLFYRHAMVMNGDYVGGNVFGYNYSQVMLEATDGIMDRNFGIGDFEVHHRRVEMTLAEGNNFELGRIMGNDGDWRKTHNTFLRNRATQSGIAGTTTGSENNYYIGNEAIEQRINNPDRPNKIGSPGCIDHGNYEVYNSVGISWDPSIANHEIPFSYYLSEKPDFFGDLAWPPYGGDLMEQTQGNNTRRSPAEVRLWSILFPEEAPSGLNASVNGTEVSLTWTSNSTNQVDFIICRSTDGVDYERIAMVSETMYSDTVSLDGHYFYYVRARNYLGDEFGAGGESDPSNILKVSDGVVSVDQYYLSENVISVYPNPAKDMLYFDLNIDKAQTISIYNSLGQLVLEEKHTDNSINVSDLHGGIYFLVVEGIRNNSYAKFIIK